MSGHVIGETMGALLIGVEAALALWGAGCMQFYFYLTNNSKGDLKLKYMAILVWMLDTAHQALIMHTVYQYLIVGFGSSETLGTIVRSLLIQVLVSAIICLIVQSYFILRIWRFISGNHAVRDRKTLNTILIVSLVGLVVAEFVSSLVYFIQASHFRTFDELPTIVNTSRAVNVLGAIGDVGISVSLVYLLRRTCRGLPGTRTESVVNRLVVFTMSTGLLTSLCAVMSLITITAFPNTFIYITFYVTISRLYTNSLLATLNARDSIQNGLQTERDTKSISVVCFNYATRDDLEIGAGEFKG